MLNLGRATGSPPLSNSLAASSETHPEPAPTASPCLIPSHARPAGGKERKSEHRAWIVDAAVAAVRSTILIPACFSSPTVCQIPRLTRSFSPRLLERSVARPAARAGGNQQLDPPGPTS